MDALTAPVPMEQLGSYEPALGAYERWLRPQLLGSALAKGLVSVGSALPVVGRPAHFPAR